MKQKYVNKENALALRELGFRTNFENGDWYYVTMSNGEDRSFCWTDVEDEPYETYKPVIAPYYQEAINFLLVKLGKYSVEIFPDGSCLLHKRPNLDGEAFDNVELCVTKLIKLTDISD